MSNENTESQSMYKLLRPGTRTEKQPVVVTTSRFLPIPLAAVQPTVSSMQGVVGRGIIYQITFCTSAFKFGVFLQANTEAFKNKTQDFREFTRLLLLGLKGRGGRAG